MRGHRLRFGENMPGRTPKSGFVSEEGHSGCKFQNTAIEALKDKFSANYGLSGPIKRI